MAPKLGPGVLGLPGTSGDPQWVSLACQAESSTKGLDTGIPAEGSGGLVFAWVDPSLRKVCLAVEIFVPFRLLRG